MSGLFKDFLFGQPVGASDIKRIVLMRPNLAKMSALVTFRVFDGWQARVLHSQNGSNRPFVAVDFFFLLLDRAVRVNVGFPFSMYKHLGIDKRCSRVQKNSANIHMFTPFCC